MSKKRKEVDVFSNTYSRFLNIFQNSFLNKSGSKMSGKKGQITLFIILGMFMVLIFVLIIYFRSEMMVFKPEEIVPTNKGKVENQITSCIEKVGNDALFLIGLQGGYIKVPETVFKDKSQHLALSPMNVVPYWAVGTETYIPTLEEIKLRLDQEIEKNLRSCLFEAESFQEVYDLVEKSEITADTEIVNNKVIFNVKWNVEVRDKAGEIITELVNHLAESPVKLKKTYDLAKHIVEMELLNLKLEDLTQDLIALEHPDLPLAGLELSCNRKIWDTDQARATLQDLLRVNLRELKIKGTEFVEFPEELPYYKNHYVWDIGEDGINPKISAVFIYDNYPMTFQVTPSTGKKMSSNMLGGTNLLSILCLQNWKFTYDVVYPVLVRVRDETTGYNFNIAFSVHLIRNTPDRKNVVSARDSKKLNYITDEDYCQRKTIPMTVITQELIENKQGVYDLGPLDNVNISFTCIKYRCEMGQTSYDFSGGGGQSGLTLNYPYCAGGILRGEKGGYKEDWQRVTPNSEQVVELNLVPIFEFPLNKIKVVKHDFIDTDNLGSARELDNDELVYLKLTYDKNTTYGNLPSIYGGSTAYHQVNKIISKGIDPEIAKYDTVEFMAKADFTYQLEVSILEDNNFIGGYKNNWTVSWDQLKGAENIVFHVLSRENTNQEDLFDLVLNLDNYSVTAPLPEIR